MYYGRNWAGITLEKFICFLDRYIRWYNEKGILLPESPHWCIRHNRSEQAIKVLSRIYPDLNQEEDIEKVAEAKMLKNSLSAQAEKV